MSAPNSSFSSSPSNLTTAKNLSIKHYTHFAAHGIVFCLSCPYTSSQNVPIRTLNDYVRSLLLHAGMPPSFWVKALAMATHLLNRHPSQATAFQMPFQCLLGAPPTYDHLRVFGCLCFLNLAATMPHKLAARSTACVLLGYPTDHHGYWCLDLDTRRVITSHHVTESI